MVEFKNIVIKGDYIYAVETDLMTGESSKVKIHVFNDEYYSNPKLSSVPMKRAIWNLQRRNKEHGGLAKEELIYWG